MSDSLQPRESQHTRPPCPSPTHGVYSNSYPSSQWCHPAISSSVVPFCSCPQSFPASGSFPMSQFFAWSFSFSITPSNEHPGLISFRMDWLYLLAVQGTLKSLLQHHSSKAALLQCSAFFTVQLSHPYVTTGKTIALTRRTFVSKVMSLLKACNFFFFFYEGRDSICSTVQGWYGLCHNYLTLPLKQESSQRQHINERAWLSSIKLYFRKQRMRPITTQSSPTNFVGNSC